MDCALTLSFEQMARVVEFVIVAQIRPAVLRLALEIPAIQITVGFLRAGEVVDDVVDLGLDARIASVRERVGRRFDPFADIRVPKNLGREIVGVARDPLGRNRLRQLLRFENAGLFELGVLAHVRSADPKSARNFELVVARCGRGGRGEAGGRYFVTASTDQYTLRDRVLHALGQEGYRGFGDVAVISDGAEILKRLPRAMPKPTTHIIDWFHNRHENPAHAANRRPHGSLSMG
jgi:hypothetical protein